MKPWVSKGSREGHANVEFLGGSPRNWGSRGRVQVSRGGGGAMGAFRGAMSGEAAGGFPEAVGEASTQWRNKSGVSRAEPWSGWRQVD